jgi:hypothetical protein
MKHIELENATDGWTRNLAANAVQGSFQRQLDTTEEPNTGEVPTVGESSISTPTYTIQGGRLNSDVTNEISYSEFLDIYKEKGKELYLIITYNGSDVVPSTQSAYSDKIPVVLQSFSPNWAMSQSNRALPSYTATFVETRRGN